MHPTRTPQSLSIEAAQEALHTALIYTSAPHETRGLKTLDVVEAFPEAQNGPKAFYSMVFGLISINCIVSP